MSLVKKIAFVLLLSGIIILALYLRKPYIKTIPTENASIQFIDWYKKSGLCQISNLELPAPWDEKEKILNLSAINVIIAKLNSNHLLSQGLQQSIKKCLEVHEQVNSGMLWDSPSAEDDQTPSENLGKIHWPDGFDDYSIGFIKMLHQISCFEKNDSSKTIMTSDSAREFQFTVRGENNKPFIQVFTQLKNSQSGHWEFESYDIKL